MLDCFEPGDQSSVNVPARKQFCRFAYCTSGNGTRKTELARQCRLLSAEHLNSLQGQVVAAMESAVIMRFLHGGLRVLPGGSGGSGNPWSAPLELAPRLSVCACPLHPLGVGKTYRGGQFRVQRQRVEEDEHGRG